MSWLSRLIVCQLLVYFTLSLEPLSPALVLGQDEATLNRRHRLFVEKRQQILTALESDLSALQDWCEQAALAQAGDRLQQISRQLLKPQAAMEPPRQVQPPISPRLPVEEQQWQIQLKHHRKERAKELYSAARSALRAGFPSLAFSMIGDVIRIDPDHQWARAVLGYELFTDTGRSDDPQYAGEWVSPFEARMRRSSPPRIYDSRFGWIPSASLARYEQGQRPWQGSWISEVKEAELRRDFRNAWEVRSEHFLIRTNVSLQAGVELSEDLEVFHAWLQQNFAAFFATPDALRERFEEASARRSGRRLPAPMQVHYYATREEYQRRVQDKVPPGVETNGMYWQPDKTCYFYYRSDGTELSTMFHEATHQILDMATIEQRQVAARLRARRLNQRTPAEWILCEKSNFWLIEGLACYLESFQIQDGQISIGHPEYVRFNTARQRLLQPEVFFFVPFRQFFALGKDTFQTHPNVSQFYTQASGAVHFLLHYEDGIYRDSLIALLSAVYRPDTDNLLKEPAFDEISGVPYETLDREYRIHMLNLEQMILETGVTP